MKLTVSVTLLVAGAILAVAEEYPDFISGMKATAAATDSLTKMEQKTGPQAVRAAERLGGIYEELIPFFRQRGEKDAVRFAEEGKAAATALASAAFGGNQAAADAAFHSLTGTCRSCHQAYREKLETGKYKIK